MRIYIIVMIFLCVSSPAQAKKSDELFSRLLAAQSIRCELIKGNTASWDDGTLKIESSDFGENRGEVIFDSIDLKKGNARIIGNAGAGNVVVLSTTAGLTFIEESAFGNINFTTVFAAHDGSRRFIVVSSRHQSINGPFPSQYYGTCTILE